LYENIFYLFFLNRPFFNAAVYAKLFESDPDGRISINQFLGYVTKKFWLHQTRIGLSLYDGAGLGYLKESDLENYIFELIPTLPQLEILERSFYSFYVCTAVRKFFFFLDPLRTGKVKITEILSSGFLDQLIELRDEDISKDHLESNWFSAQSALRVYGQYLNLDDDHNGMLNKQELGRYGSGTLTDVFLERVFQECVTYGGEMDYKSYLDFVLALENRNEPQALQYIFRILDINQKGYLNPFDINYFFRAIQKQLKKYGHEPVSLRDIQDEIYDMVKPIDPFKITLVDLINSCQGETVTNILIDLNSFWTHENRESLLAEPSNSTPSNAASANGNENGTYTDKGDDKSKNDNDENDSISSDRSASDDSTSTSNTTTSK
jgi:serine/threonine-protein phosphatase 2A regulatory subunit B''